MRFGKRAIIESKTGIFHSTLSQIGKQASVDWTVGKLLNIVLLVLVLVLVVYGVSTQALNPLIDNIGGKLNEVSTMVQNIFLSEDDIASRDCHEENVANLGGGKDFLKAIDMEGKDVILNVCKNRICNISGAGVTPYRVSGEKFEKLEGGKWVDYNSLLTEGIGDAEFNWDLYNAGVGALSGAKDLYNKGFTKKFVLYGDGSGANREVYAIWQNGYWRVSEREQMPDGTGWVRRGDKEWERINDMGKAGSTKTVVTSLYSGTDDNLAINAFVERVKGGDDDKVYWAVLESDEIYNKDVNKGQKIGTLVGDEKSFRIFGDFDELDDNREVEKLKEEFAKRKEKYLEDVRVSVDRVANTIKDKTIVINEKEFIIKIEEDGNFPIITLSSNGKIFGLRHSAYANVNSDFLKGVALRDFPVVLVEKVGLEWKEIGNEEYYRLPEKNFNEVYRATLISEFLKSRCK